MTLTTRLICLLLAGAALGGCAASTAPLGGSRETGDVTRLSRIQQQQSRRIEQLEKQLLQLESRLEEQQAATVELQQRVAQNDTRGWQKTEPTPDLTGPIVPVGSPTELYLQAFADYAAGRYSQAITGFSAFVSHYPGNSFAGNAQYWLGECYYALDDFPQAVREFEKAAYQYPDSSKAPDALLRMIPALQKLNHSGQAEEVRQLLLRRYPDSQAAARARANI